MNNALFTGTGVALITPFTIQGAIDYDALARLMDHVIDHGVDFLVAMGTTAETPTLTKTEKQALLSFIIQHNAGRKPLVLGIGSNATQNVLEDISALNTHGIDALLILVPYYNRPNQEGMYQHFKAIAKHTELPIIIYNIPSRSAANIEPRTILRLADECPNIVGVKEASGRLQQMMELIQYRRKDFVVLSGDDALALPLCAVGGDGVISVVSNAFPREFSDMVRFARIGDLSKARILHYRLLDLVRLIFADGNPSGIKCVLHHMGLIHNLLRLPLIPVNSEVEMRIEDVLISLTDMPKSKH